MSAGERAAAAAGALVGARFRLHGREPETGLDCVGLAALAWRAGGHAGPTPGGYRLRGGDADTVARALGGRAVRCDGTAPGDLLLFRAGPGQLHLGIRTAAGLVHADGALGRVVERPGDAPWPLVAAWRMV